jgi:hypothetical protein
MKDEASGVRDRLVPCCETAEETKRRRDEETKRRRDNHCSEHARKQTVIGQMIFSSEKENGGVGRDETAIRSIFVSSIE